LGLREQVLGRLNDTVHALADQVEPIGAGWVARTRSMSEVWTLNQVYVAGPASVEQVIALADAHQADLSYRHVLVEDEGVGHQLEEVLPGAGWKAHRLVLMALVEPPEWHSGATDGVVELDEPQMLALMRRWLREDDPRVTPSCVDQLDEYHRREGALWHERCFGRLGRNGVPAAVTKLRAQGRTAWVEDVYTVPEERRQGHARMLVAHATGLARSGGYDLTFLLADDNNWPKHLYAEAGFRPIGRTWTFHRDL
jgi:GNAT superfamily N-acetyltransferase